MSEENAAKIEEEYIDPSNLAALEEATKPQRVEFPLTLPSGAKILVPLQVGGMALGMEASRGERFKDNEVNDPDKTRRIFIKKMNFCLLDGWHIVDDVTRKLGSTAQLLAQRKIPVSIIRNRDWNDMNETAFPGVISSTAESVQDRANAIRDQSLPVVSGPGNSEPGSN